MKVNGQTHPARSVDFLSRLHDGELDAGERARFESHRAHCAECRRSVVEFEDAISLFRSARSNPPRSDLAVRILRKVQSTNRPRTPFPRRFQIDLGWAALMLTALFAVLIMTPLAVRRTPSAPAVPPVSPPPVASEQVKPAVDAPPVPPRAAENRAQRPNRRAAAPMGSVAESPSESGARQEATPRKDRPEAEAVIVSGEAPLLENAPKTSAERAGGEESADVSRSTLPTLHLSITSIDGFGPPPALLSSERLEWSGGERGRAYVVLVDSQGSVRRVSAERRGARGIAAESPVTVKDASIPLSRLRFEPGNRPRRLLVRVE